MLKGWERQRMVASENQRFKQRPTLFYYTDVTPARKIPLPKKIKDLIALF